MSQEGLWLQESTTNHHSSWYSTPCYVRKVKNSQARTGHQRGMDGRETDDDDTLERHTDTNKLTGHTARLAATHPEWTYTSLRATFPLPPPPAPAVPRDKQQQTNTDSRQQTNTDRRQGLTSEARADCSASSNLRRPRGTDETVCGVL